MALKHICNVTDGRWLNNLNLVGCCSGRWSVVVLVGGRLLFWSVVVLVGGRCFSQPLVGGRWSVVVLVGGRFFHSPWFVVGGF